MVRRGSCLIKVSEIFHSVQGEGLFAGMPSVFIRFSGCNLRCKWCDTPYASWYPEGETQSLDSLVERLDAWPNTEHVVLTGGEPFLFPVLTELVDVLKRKKKVVTIETAGTKFLATQADLISISPKMANSTPDASEFPKEAKLHESNRQNEEVLLQFTREAKQVQWKFVMDSLKDLSEVEDLLTKVGVKNKSTVFLMPQSLTAEDLMLNGVWVSDLCLETGYRYCDRTHIRLWDGRKGT